MHSRIQDCARAQIESDSLTVVLFPHFSLAVHPDRITIATGQTAGHGKCDGKVCSVVNIKLHLPCLNALYSISDLLIGTFLSLTLESGIPSVWRPFMSSVLESSRALSPVSLFLRR